MQVEIKSQPKSEVLVSVELTAEELVKHEDTAAQLVSEKIDVPGFRKGQAPKAFVIAKIGADAFFQEVLNVALPRSYFHAISEKKLAVVSRPDVKVISKSPLKYEARVAVMPEVTLKGFEKIQVPSEPVTVTDKEIDEIVEEMRKYRATFKPIDRGIAHGDRIEIDFQGFDEGGAALDKTKSANHPLFLGEGSMVPGFEDQLKGMKVGEKKKFPVKFPKDYHHEPLKNKTVHFEVELKRAEETILPELNEELVAQLMGQKKPIPEFREAIKTDLAHRKKIEQRRARENTLLEKFLAGAKFDVPPLLLQEEVDYMISDFARELQNRGLNLETYFKKLKDEKRDLRKEFEPEADKRVRIRLILNFLFRELKIEVNDEEMTRAEQKLLERADAANREGMQKELAQKGEVYLKLKNNILLEKLFVHYLGA